MIANRPKTIAGVWVNKSVAKECADYIDAISLIPMAVSSKWDRENSTHAGIPVVGRDGTGMANGYAEIRVSHELYASF